MKFEIKSRFSGSILFTLETESLKLCIEAAVKAKADLGGADLHGADLRGAYLGGADLGGTDLRGAYLGGADLGGTDLRGAKIIHGDVELLLVGERPALQLGGMGSRDDYLLALLTDHGVYVRAGCFFDTLEAFRAAVAKEHGANIHAQEYGLAIQMIELHAKLWTPVTDNQNSGGKDSVLGEHCEGSK